VSGQAEGPAPAWHALQAALAHDPSARLPFHVLQDGQSLEVGSVARSHLAALTRWPEALQLDEDHGVTLTVPAAEREAFFAQANTWLHAEGLIAGWRDERYPVLAWRSGELLAVFERAASRFWGTLTFGAHCNGYVADEAGRPQALWIARRSFSKPTDPGLLDNLIGGGVPHGQSPAEAVLREGWEEAGLQPAQMHALQAGSVLRLARDIPEGFQHEWLSVYDLALPAGLVPCNQDGEVAELRCLPIAEALALAASEQMTVDAGLVTLDFALRRGLLPQDLHGALEPRLSTLRVGAAELPRQATC
jgi:8-oxo-dGTP pyrophosphatase MutT (NUDIX family)